MADDVLAPTIPASGSSPAPGPDRVAVPDVPARDDRGGDEYAGGPGSSQADSRSGGSPASGPVSTDRLPEDPAPAVPCAPEPPGIVGLLVPPLLAAISTALGWLVTDDPANAPHMFQATAVMVLIMALRVVLEGALARYRPGSAVVVWLYAVHVALTLMAIASNPLVCIYAFVGYLDAFRFVTGWQLYVLVPVTALLMALGQAGGIDVLLRMPLLFAGIAVVNLFLATLMLYLSLADERRSAERDRTLLALQQATQRNDALQEELLRQARESGVDEERARLSREIHDTVAQGLVGVIRQLETVGGELDAADAAADDTAGTGDPAGTNGATGTDDTTGAGDAAGTGDPAGTENAAGGARRRIAVAEEAARDCLVEARRAVEALAPQQLTNAGTAHGLGELVARWARAHRIVATFDADDAPCHGAHAAVLVRIAQEALANVSRHSGADTVTVVLSGSDDEQVLQIIDDGRGFDARSITRGHGLANMAQRVEAVEGHLHVSSSEGGGTTVIATVPR